MWPGDFDWHPADEGASATPSREFVESFVRSMPGSYAMLFDHRAVSRHAAVSLRRRTRPACAELWRSSPDGSAALCIVAQDRPGLLSAIAAALVLHRLDVLTALVFSRVLPGEGSEAIDLVWVRRASRSDKDAIGPEETDSIGEVVGAIVSGQISLEQVASQNVAPPPGSEPGVRVCFEASEEDKIASLLVEAPDRPGVLLTITLALFQQGAQIVRSLVRTAGGRAFNRFELCEFSGAVLSNERRDQIRGAVHAALTLSAVPGSP